MQSMAKFFGKVAVITGASSGIGKGAAIELARQGCKLVLNGRNVDNLTKSKQECLEASAGQLSNDHVLPVIGDISKLDDCKNLIQKSVDHFGQIDILINSAGIISKGSTETTSLEDYDTMMNINAKSVFYLMQLTIPHLRKTKGNVVNVSSVCGLRAFPGVIAYNMSKAALDQLTRCSALELAPDQIRVNSVNPGVIITELHRRSGMNPDDYAKFLEHSKNTHALGRAGEVHEVAKTIAFLASEDASYVTGVTLSVDGGRGQMCPR